MAGSESPDLSNFGSTLSDLLSTNNDARLNAEAAYDKIPVPEKIFLLMAACGSQGFQVEEVHLAAILLRRLFVTEFEATFSKISPEINQQIKTRLLELLSQNIDIRLRKKIGEAAVELARHCIDDDGNNHWPDILMFLFNAVRSPDPALKEVALLMFGAIPGIFGNQQSRYIDVIHTMLTQSLIDQSFDVRFAAVKATTFFFLIHEKETAVLKQFSDCLILYLQFLTQAIENGDPRAEDVLKYLIDLVDKCPQSFRSQLDYLFKICIEYSTCITIPEPYQHLALEILITVMESAPAMVRKLCSNHIKDLISVILRMMSVIPDDPNWDFDEDTEEENDSKHLVGEAALDRIACTLGGKTVLPIVLNSLTGMLSSAEWKHRYAALMTVSAIGEGCNKQMSGILQEIVDGVLPFLLDSHSRVAYAACNALGQMASDFAPLFQKKFGEKVISGLCQLIGDPGSPRVQAHAGAALVNFLEECPKNILYPHLNNIVDTLECVLNSKLQELVQNGRKRVLEQVVVTIASLAGCAEEKFVHYYDKFMTCLKFIIQNAVKPELRLLRGKTIECVSLIGLAVGRDKFFKDAGEVMELLLKSQTDEPLSEDDPQLTYMIASWARICKIMGKEFEPYLPYVIEPVLKTAALKPEIAILDAEDMRVVESDDAWEFVNLGDKHNYGIRTVGLEEKSTACQMLVCYARELKEGFGPYIEDTLKLMVPMLKFYFHDGVRTAAAEIMQYLLEASKIRGGTYLQEMWRYILPPFLQALESEPEHEVLCDEMSAFCRCIEVLDSRCLSHDEMLLLVNLLNKKLVDHFEKANARAEQRKEEDYDDVLEETLEREDDDDVYILSKISDVVCTLLYVYKQEFFPYFDLLLPHYIRLLEPSGSLTDRQWALCVFADVIEHGGPQSCSKYQQYFLNPLLQSLSAECPDLRQTATYTIGCLGQFGGPDFAKVCADSIPLLMKIIADPESRSEENIKATENAISAVGKFLMYNNSFINMDQILPLFISWLPIWEDEQEATFVYGFLCTLLETNNCILLGAGHSNLPRIFQIIAEAFYKEAIDPSSDVGKRITTLIKDLQKNPELFSACIGALSPYQQEALHAALTKQ